MSQLLSVERFDDGDARKQYERELELFAPRVRAGEAVPFDDAEVERAIQHVELGSSLPWWAGIKAFAMVMLWLAPLWLLIGVALWLWRHT